MWPRPEKLPLIFTAVFLAVLCLAGKTGAKAADLNLMTQGRELLAQAEHTQRAADQAMQTSHRIRTRITEYRRQLQQLSGNEAGSALQTIVRDYAGEVERWRQQGSELRTLGESLQRRALDLLAAGMAERWRDWIIHTQPLASSGASNQPTRAHNSRERSVHPNMPAGPGPATRQSADMTLQTPAATGQQLPGDLDLGTFQLSRARHFIAHIEVEADAGAAPATVPENAIHQWRLVVCALNGEPVRGAEITVGGHMPGHVHGLPTQPRVTGEIAPGVYRLGGMKFQMRGWWVIDLDIRANGVTDNVVFNLSL